jgi:secreted trypsin-like serine protease
VVIEAYRQLACDAGSASACRDLAKAQLASDPSVAGRAAALAQIDRACQLAQFNCREATEVRDAPALAARCDAGDQGACIALAKLLSAWGGLQEDRARALTLFGAACDAQAAEACMPAALLVFERWDDIGVAAPAQAEAYLSASCVAGTNEACEKLADELATGERLVQDPARAAALYHPQCDEGQAEACDFLQMQVLNDPSGPLPLAHADFAPQLTPEEDAEAAAKGANQGTQEFCNTTTVVYEGTSYSDTSCVFVGGAIRGFAARQGETPWQALLWRPEKLNPGTRSEMRLTPDQQVLCGGSVIRTGWILTAAHCLTDDRGKAIATAGYRVRLGLSNPYAEEGLSYPILQVIPHPKSCRNKPCPRSLDFDVALVQYDPARNSASGRVLPVSRIRLDPLPLAARKSETVERVFTYGWGRTEVVGGMIPDHLRGARVKLRDAATCTSITKFNDPERRDTVLCADERIGTGGGQACSGDSGGPLITFGDTDQRPTLIGVVSGGVKCGSLGEPSRYVRVAHPEIISWINATLNPASRR